MRESIITKQKRFNLEIKGISELDTRIKAI